MFPYDNVKKSDTEIFKENWKHQENIPSTKVPQRERVTKMMSEFSHMWDRNKGKFK